MLLDIGLPDMDGFEVARRLRALAGGDEVLLVALTGWGQPEVRSSCEDAGFDDHLVYVCDIPLEAASEGRIEIKRRQGVRSLKALAFEKISIPSGQ